MPLLNSSIPGLLINNYERNELETLEKVTFIAALVSLGLSLVSSLWRLAAVRASAAGNSSRTLTLPSGSRLPAYLTIALSAVALLFITLSLSARAAITGHGPFSNMYEFAVAFAWGILAVGLFFWWRYRMHSLIATGVVIALGLLFFAESRSSQSAPLVPALQQSLLLTTHVASAVISYGAFTIGFGAALLYLFRSPSPGTGNRESEILDEISYRTVMIGFPFMTLVIVLGALWADISWGHYWSWDPKETASLVTWLLYAGYLHARLMRGWRGRRAAILLIIGFAAVIFTFLGNYIFAGLHSYS
jgi:cytochrome c-type biogenesis protein CcsB